MQKQNFATQPRDWRTTSEEAWSFDENLHATGRPSTAPNGQNEPLHLGPRLRMQMIRRYSNEIENSLGVGCPMPITRRLNSSKRMPRIIKSFHYGNAMHLYA